jgi:hypothetical protein
VLLLKLSNACLSSYSLNEKVVLNFNICVWFEGSIIEGFVGKTTLVQNG